MNTKDCTVTRYLIVTGNPVDGFTFYGPFETFEDAEKVAETISSGGDWWITEQQGPL